MLPLVLVVYFVRHFRARQFSVLLFLVYNFPVRQFPVLPFLDCHFPIGQFPVRHSPVHQFPPLQLRRSFSSPALSIPVISSVNWQSVIFSPCDFVRHLPVLHFPPPAFMIARHFPVLQIQVTRLGKDTVAA